MTLLVQGAQTPSRRKDNFFLYLPLLGFVALAFLVAAVAYYSFWEMEGLIEGGKLRDLGAIADSKVGQISAWREVQKRTGESFSNGSLLADEFDRWQEEGMPSSEHKHHVRQLLSELQYVNGYKTLSLLDRQGVVRISTNGDFVPDAEEVRLAAQAMDSRKAVFSDFHRSGGGVYIDLIVPLTTSRKTGRVVGAAIMVIDPYTSLYPLIQSWPTRRSSAETLLVRRDGNEILFLNELHHNKGAILSLRIPFGKPNLPAAMAVRGETGTTDGIDYRGVAVVAAMREIPGTPWFMVAKIDKAELFAPINQIKAWATGLGFVVALLGGSLFFVWLRGIRTRHRLVTTQRDAALEREMLVKHFEYLTKYANDIILIADETGKIVEANERALEAYGYTREELLRMKISDLSLPTEDTAIFRGQLERLKEQGELRYETVNRRKDGTAFPLEVSIRVIEVQGAKYLHGIARDITARKHTENALRKNETMLRESQRMAQIGSWELDLVNNVLSWSDENYRIFGIDRTRFGASYEAFLNIVHPDDRPMVNQIYTDSVKNRTPYDVVHRLLFPDQRVKYVREWCETFYDSDGRPIRSIGTTQDVTAYKLAEDELRASENRYRLLVESSPFCIHEIDLEGRLQSINKAGLNMLGLDDAGEICGMPYLGAVSQQDAGRVGALLQDAITNGTSSHFEFAATGEVPLYFKSCFVPIKDAGGKVLKLMGITEDITERRLAAERLLKSAEEIEDLYDHAPCGYHSLDKNGIFVRVNNTELEWLGYARDELVGKRSFMDILAPSGDTDFRRYFQKLMEQGGMQELEVDILRKNGAVLPALLSSTAIYDIAGRFVMSRSTMSDISARRLAEKVLRESESRFRTTVNSAPIIIWVADANEEQVYSGCNFFNQRWHEFTGHNSEEPLVCDWISYVHPDDAERCLETYQEAFRQVSTFNLEYRLRRRDGAYRWMADSGIPRFTAEDIFCGYTGTCVDMTEQKQFESLRAEMEHIGRLNIVGEMASGLAHELSQPLTACDNYLAGCLRRMSEKDWDREKLHKAVQLAHTQAERAGKIINHLKDIVRKQSHEPILTDVNELVINTLTFLGSEIKRHDISVRKTLLPLPQIMVRKVEIEQVLLNLCENAIKSMQSSPQRLLRVHTCITESGEIQVTVSDSGKGIPSAMMENLFNPFHTSKQDRIGLGLAICRSFIENHGGHIWANPQRESGAEFHFTLPLGGRA